MSLHDILIQERVRKAQAVRDLGHDPYGQSYDGRSRKRTIADIKNWVKDVEHVPENVYGGCGRIMLKNDRGKLKFFHVQDETGRIQLMLSKAELESNWPIIELLDMGDLVGFEGTYMLTKTGEPTIRIQNITLMCKSLATPPEKHYGITDEEILVRQPYRRMIYEDGALQRFKARGELVKFIRQHLWQAQFQEVETPVLQPIAGGAAAKPFITKHNALGCDYYLRIAPELYLKRLMVGGMERIFEIGKNFRNEGIDQTHNPEFTMCEAYWAYADYQDMLSLFMGMISNIVTYYSKPHGFADTGFDANTVKYVSYLDAVREYTDLRPENVGTTREECLANPGETFKARALIPSWYNLLVKDEHPRIEYFKLLDEVFDKIVLPKLPGWVVVSDYPVEICPLTKPKKENPQVAERWECFVNGMEIANSYTELNDPILQEQNFRLQANGDESKIDHDFLEALRVGMPPAGGLGFGVDRLAMLFTGTNSIRDVISFPLVKPT